MFLKYLLPLGQFKLVSPFTRNDIVARLATITGPAHEFLGPDDISDIDWVFVGKISDDTFCLMTPEEEFNIGNLSRSRNMFRPVLSGKLMDISSGTLILVTVRMQVTTCILHGSMLAMVLIVAGVGMTQSWPSLQGWPFVLGFLAILMVPAHSFFWAMVERARLKLTQTLSVPI